MLIVCSTRASLFQSPGSHLKPPRHNVGMCRDKSLVDRGGRNEHAVADRCPQRVNGAVHTGYGIERSKAFAATSATSNCAVSRQRTRRSAYMAAISVLAAAETLVYLNARQTCSLIEAASAGVATPKSARYRRAYSSVLPRTGSLFTHRSSTLIPQCLSIGHRHRKLPLGSYSNLVWMK